MAIRTDIFHLAQFWSPSMSPSLPYAISKVRTFGVPKKQDPQKKTTTTITSLRAMPTLHTHELTAVNTVVWIQAWFSSGLGPMTAQQALR